MSSPFLQSCRWADGHAPVRRSQYDVRGVWLPVTGSTRAVHDMSLVGQSYQTTIKLRMVEQVEQVARVGMFVLNEAFLRSLADATPAQLAPGIRACSARSTRLQAHDCVATSARTQQRRAKIVPSVERELRSRTSADRA